MGITDEELSTGLPGLDEILNGLIPGDNIVWQVSSVEDYLALIQPYCEYALKAGKRLVYFRFANHPTLATEEMGAEVHEIYPDIGFESFIAKIHQVIKESGHGAFYVFDCFSQIALECYSDRMLGNFFMLTCPYLYDLRTITYFGMLRNYHSYHATSPITETAQIVLDVYHHDEKIYIHPLKVDKRYSPTMHMLHEWHGDSFVPVTESATISEVLTSEPWSGLESATYRLGVWTRVFVEGDTVQQGIKDGEVSPEKGYDAFRRLLRMAITSDPRVLHLAEKYFSLSDILDIWKRMIGTGFIGGKSVGMLLARAILKKNDPRWNTLLEAHDSFYIGSEVFYTYLVLNDCWLFRQQQKDPETFLDEADKGRERILNGDFPDYITQRFVNMLNYFGQSPIIVRSSSLLEDNFGNSFAGKYESVFCANQGPLEKRLDDFLSAVRTIYTSCMSENALRYRAQRGLLQRDEQMALLVQRVSGAPYGTLFYPQIAGVGFSVNPYVWSDYIDPEAGVLRLVFGLGTRAVERFDDDYTCLVALNIPERQPEGNKDDTAHYAQRRVDVIDLKANRFLPTSFEETVTHGTELPIELFADRDEAIERFAKERGKKDLFPWVLTFKKLLSATNFAKDMKEMLSILQNAYDYPVDIEFAVNFRENGEYKINLLQCRPLQFKGGGTITDPPAKISSRNLLLKAEGAVIGHSTLSTIDRIIYINPSVYGQLSEQDRYSIARLIGKITHVQEENKPHSIMLLGPGRWGTTTPSLGIPVSFPEINTVSVLCEIVAMRDDLVPDVSLGTHFFCELVEMDILYFALFPHQKDNVLNTPFFEDSPNHLLDIVPGADKWTHAVKVIFPEDTGFHKTLKVNANTLKRKVVCYFE